MALCFQGGKSQSIEGNLDQPMVSAGSLLGAKGYTKDA